MADLPAAVLFACGWNSIRSPMAEALLKHYHGHSIYVDSVGVREREVDGFAVAALMEMGLELSGHRGKTFDQLEDSSFDLVITLSMIAVGFLVFRPQADIPGYVWGGIGIFASIAVIVIGISLQSGRIRFTDRLKFLGAYSDVWRDLARKPGQLGAVAGTTAALWGVKGAAAYIIVLGLDIDLSLPETHVLMLAVTTLGLTLPGLPSGLGPIEFAATFFLPFYGVGETNSLAFGLVLHGTFLLPPIAIAVATLLIVGGPWPSPREADA